MYVTIATHNRCFTSGWVKVIADIDGDGIDEMVVGASYFYDRE
jgi:hypothetical protein